VGLALAHERSNLSTMHAGHGVVEDDSFDNGGGIIYPLSELAYAGAIQNADDSEHLFVHESANGTWKSDWAGEVVGWVPLHGSSLLVAEQVDGGLALEVVGSDAGGSPSCYRACLGRAS